jgi:uncharacterized integral membrane protein
MNQRKPLTRKQNSIGLFILILSMSISIILLFFYTIPNENVNKYCSMGEYLNRYYINNHARFNYLNGLWLMPLGLFMVVIFIMFNFPDIKIKKRD